MKLSKEQELATKHITGPALILAVPGAGKTTVLIHRTINLILEHDIRPDRILSITFSRASAKDMSKRFRENFKDISTIPISFSTIHSFCFNLIREYAYRNNIKYTLIEGEKSPINKYNLIKNLYLQTNKSYITEEKLESLINAIGYIKNMMITVDEFLDDKKPGIDGFNTIFSQYEKYKRDNNLIDFDDMLSITLNILNKNKYVLEKYRNKYDYIQLDEGQDTSKIQMEIFKKLAFPKNNLFVVADDDQSIYGFRGADPKGLLNFKSIFPNGKIFFMQKNYRSSKNIVSVCNRFIKSNTLRYNKTISTDNSFLEPINIIKVDSMLDQYNYILKDIENRDLKNSAILYRNNLSSIGLIDFLEKNKIDFYMRDIKVKFFNHWLVQDILNFMQFARDTSNMTIYENIYYKKKGYISKKQINFAKTLNYKWPVFDRIMKYPDIPVYYKSTLRELSVDFRRLSELNPLDSISFIEYNLEYEKYLKENSMKFGYTYDSLKTILYYLKLIAKETSSLDELIARFKYLESLCLNSRNQKNTLTLSTIHSSKGLEFDRVYIIDLVDGHFPSSSSIEAYEKKNIDDLEEERRLFYVGMSRAKYHLSLFSVNNLGNKLVNPSRFLDELQA